MSARLYCSEIQTRRRERERERKGRGNLGRKRCEFGANPPAKIRVESLARCVSGDARHNSLLRDNGRSGVNSAEFNYETPWGL